MIWVGILGPKGNFRETLSKLIAGHPEAQISTMMDPQEICGAEEYMCGSYDTKPGYRKIVNAVKKSDIIFNGLSGAMAEDIYSKALSYGKRAIDISNAYFGCSSEGRVCGVYPGSVYGLPELYKNKMKTAPIAANPSSRCAGILLGLAPLAASNLADADTAIIESRSGITSLGRYDKISETDMTVNGGSKIYKMDSNGYAEEVNDQMHALFGRKVSVSYAACIIPGFKGITTTIKVNPNTDLCGNSISDIYGDFYKHSPFIEVCSNDTIIEGRNGLEECLCKIKASINKDNGNITVTTILDDAVKGAASQAIQTMNLMCGIDSEIGL
ncbi:MAG TPA: hypothetical protein PLW11_01075 [Bacillota bacterium]|nr:hypothetical protein [Bacillota bacterium]